MPAPTQSGKVEHGGAQIYWASFGKADGPPVILLHGGLGSSDHFAFQLPALVDKFRVVVIDSRGQGRSTLPPEKLSYHLMASDVTAVMDALAIKRAAFAGWSDGGAIALDLAVHEPTRVERFFIIGTNYDSAGSKPRRKQKPSQAFRRYMAKCKADHLAFGNSLASWTAINAALLPVWRSMGNFTKEDLQRIEARALITLGDHDEIIEPAQIKEMGTLIPHGAAKIFAGVSHFAIWQDPASINAALVAFLAEK